MNALGLFVGTEEPADLLSNGPTLRTDLLIVWIVEHHRLQLGQIMPAPAPLLHGGQNAAMTPNDLKSHLLLLNQIIHLHILTHFSLQRRMGHHFAAAKSDREYPACVA